MKIPIYCSLIPTDLLISLGFEPHFVTAADLGSCGQSEYHCAFHENLCSYSKALYDYFIKNHDSFDAIIIPTSCDAMKKLHNALKLHVPEEKVLLVDFPKVKNGDAARYLAVQFEVLKEALLSIRDKNGIKTTLQVGLNALNPGSPITGFTDKPKSQVPKIGILGANVQMGAIEKGLENFGFEPVYLNHCLAKSGPDDFLTKLLNENGLQKYTESFLERNSCPRTDDYSYKKAIAKRITDENLCGLIVNTLKFCDFHPFDFRYFKKEVKIPVLLIEHEMTANYEGQTMTRVEAFLENVKKIKFARNKKSGGSNGKYYVGIDSGSHATKLVCIDGKEKVVSRQVVPTGTSVTKSAEKLLNALAGDGVSKKEISSIIGTGYGRSKITGADNVVTEITCHALGAHYILGKRATIIDIGGQDSKAITIDENGGVVRFAMNDKCAAGTGRFLEVMSAKLEMTLEEFSQLAKNAKKSVPISSMCSVFAESEIISLIASGCSKEEIAKGVHRAIAERTIALVKRVEGKAPFYMAGGVAKNIGLVAELERSLGEPIHVLKEPQFSGALGAAIFALRSS